MKHFITLTLLLVITPSMWGQDTWVRTFGRSRTTPILHPNFVTTSNKCIVFGGSTDGDNVEFEGMSGRGYGDIFVIGFDGVGNQLWKKILGGTGPDVCESIHGSSDGGVILSGYTYSNDGDFEGLTKNHEGLTKNHEGLTKSYMDVFVIKLDEEGQVQWKKVFGGTERDQCNSVTTTSDGDVLITGHTLSNDGDFKGNKGDGDVFVIKLDKNGNVLWKKTFGGTSNDYGNSITTTTDGDVLITGETLSNNGDFKGRNTGTIFIMKLDKDGNLHRSKK